MPEFFSSTDARLKTMKSKYGIWPTTVWPCDFSDQVMQAVKQEIGDIGGACLLEGTQGFFYDPKERRRGHASFPGEIGRSGAKGKYRMILSDGQKGSSCGKDFTRTGKGSTRSGWLDSPSGPDSKSVYGGKVTASVFNPVVAQVILNCFAPESGVCWDPFAGGGTRAILAAKNGLTYKGTEIRKEEVDAVGLRCQYCGVADSVTIFHGDGRSCPAMPDGSADFCYTCPPYYDLEKYEGGENDLSMMPTYEAFLTEMEKVVAEERRILKFGALACWVVGLHRDKEGELLAMNHDISRLHKLCGFRHKEEIILAHKNNGAIQRVGSFEKGDRRLVRMYEYVLVFVKK